MVQESIEKYEKHLETKRLSEKEAYPNRGLSAREQE